MPRACLSLLGLEEAARAAAQGSLAKRKVGALKSFRMMGHGLLSGAGQGKGLQIMGTAHQNPRGKCGFLSRGVERREGGQQGSLEGQGQGRSLAPFLCGWGAPAGFHPVSRLASRFWTGLKARCYPGLATALCGTICGIAQTCTVSEVMLLAHLIHSANVNCVPEPIAQLRRKRSPSRRV